MNRIAETFSGLAARRAKGLIAFITAGDPNIEVTPEFMHALVRGGADIIELGVPFSDPMADGPVIQRASERALAAGVTPEAVFEVVRRFRTRDTRTPVVLMGYLNPFEHLGVTAVATRAHAAGCDGFLMVDLPPEEAREFNAAVRAAGLDQVFLVAPNSPAARIERICSMATGFVYFVAVKGVTGDKAVDVHSVDARIAETRRLARVPVGIGFGIRTPHAAAAAALRADAIIVGSALVEIVERDGTAAAAGLQTYVAELRAAIDRAAA
jgi:tryptophan synthase alpha chain